RANPTGSPPPGAPPASWAFFPWLMGRIAIHPRGRQFAVDSWRGRGAELKGLGAACGCPPPSSHRARSPAPDLRQGHTGRDSSWASRAAGVGRAGPEGRVGSSYLLGWPIASPEGTESPLVVLG